MQMRYFIIHTKTDVMHIHGFCEHTKPRKVPIRLFDSQAELEAYVGRKLRLCKSCQRGIK